MTVLVTIGDWEAIPVRALPYVSPALTPDRIAEGLAASGLATLLAIKQRPLLGGLKSYYLEGARPVEIPFHAWIRYRSAFEDQADGQPIDPEYRHGIKLLPAGVFVWRWEFEAVYGGKVPHDPMEPENEMVRIAWYEPLIPADMREIVMEGLLHLLEQPAAHPPAPATEPPQAGPEPAAMRGRRRAPTDPKLLETIAALLAAWPGGKPPSGKDLEKAAQSVGVSTSDDTIRGAIAAAREIAPGLPK